MRAAGRPVVVAPTHKAVAALRSAGVEAHCGPPAPAALRGNPRRGGVFVVDEVSSSPPGTGRSSWPPPAAAHGAALWWVSDARQAQVVAAGGLVVEVERVGAEGRIPSTTLTVNRRQRHPAERRALERFRSTGPRGTLSSGRHLKSRP